MINRTKDSDRDKEILFIQLWHLQSSKQSSLLPLIEIFCWPSGIPYSLNKKLDRLQQVEGKRGRLQQVEGKLGRLQQVEGKLGCLQQGEVKLGCLQ